MISKKAMPELDKKLAAIDLTKSLLNRNAN